MAVSTNRRGGGGAVAITANRIPVGNGTTIVDGIVRQDAALGTNGAICVGAAPLNTAAIFRPSWQAFYQVNSGANGVVNAYHVDNSGPTGGSGFLVTSGGVRPAGFWCANTAFAGNFMGRALAGATVFDSNGAPILFGTLTAHDAVFGANNVEHLACKGDGTGTSVAKALTHTPTALSDAGIAVTSTVGLGNYHFSGLTANRAHTLVSRASVSAGYRVTYSLTDDPGAFAVNLTRNGTDTILGGTAVYALNTDRESVTFEAAGSTDWIVVARS